MMDTSQPLVSVVTPVYNGAKYLVECIESVLSQTYQNWEYIIVNNCSTDATLEIAEKYAASERRIRVVTNSSFVNVIENHNIGFRLISKESAYCKIVCADDWIYPECLSRMVELGEKHPSAAVIGAYVVSSRGVTLAGLPVGKSIFSGYDVCRSHLFGGPEVMGAPSAVLYRSQVIRKREDFFPGTAPSADAAVYYEILRDWDFGFVHQILSFERVHDEALSGGQRQLHAFLLDKIAFLKRYAGAYGTLEEQSERFRQLMNEYYGTLATALVHRYPRSYWDYHQKRLSEVGLSIEGSRLARALVTKALNLILNPKRPYARFFHASEKRWRPSFSLPRIASEEQPNQAP